GFTQRTGIDLPGEATGIFHPLANVGPVELATMAFGQSFQITPLQLLRASAATINGGYMITPHVVSHIIDNDGNLISDMTPERGEQIVSAETSELLKEILESVVYVGTGNRTYIPGYRIGGKTATSQKLPRGTGRYIASFIAFAPAENAEIIALVLVDEPQGVYYGGQVAGPVMKELLANVLPYLNIEPIFNDEELEMDGVGQVSVPDFIGQRLNTARNTLNTLGLESEAQGYGDIIVNQFPIAGELVNHGTKIILYIDTAQ
ncbi:MAG: penicillin-binding transpeptidase domain-containing protein, partial [Defluviitaleaceae bacterium]|nr:penicillin-binding transpeptidase domain-containing protein [Defluviitaleaceae bacterium]